MVWIFFTLSVLFAFAGCISAVSFVRTICEKHYRYNPFKLPWLGAMAIAQLLISMGIALMVTPGWTPTYAYLLFAGAAMIAVMVAIRLYHHHLHPFLLAPVLTLMALVSVFLLPANIWSTRANQNGGL